MPRPLAVHLDVPDAARPRVAYAVGALLDGLGVGWAPEASGADVYVGERPEAAPAGALRLRTDPQSVLRPHRAAASRLGGLHHGARRWPLPTGPGGEHAPDGSTVVAADVVGSTFWWLAGMQEHATPGRDAHGRFRHADSLQAHLGLAEQPAVDGYRLWLADALRARGVAVPEPAGWRVALTLDVDGAATRRARAAALALARGRPAEALRRGLGPDARWASLVALRALAARHGVAPTVFVKGGATAREDVPYAFSRRLRALLSGWQAERAEVGLHPSYFAHDHAARLAGERARVARAAGRTPTSVRTHFLRWHEPATPRVLARAGFALDSSLGFAEAPGFRRGTAAPFRLYDLAADRPTGLWELAPCVMDTTLYAHLGLGAEAASERAWQVLDAARRVGGCAVVVWHDDTGFTVPASRRLDGLDRLLGRARQQGARLTGLAEAAGALAAVPRPDGVRILGQGPIPSPRGT